MKKYFSQWVAQFLVTGELSRQGYKVAMLMGNAPRTDILVEAPSGVTFRVQCKGQRGKNFWLIKEDKVQDDLYFVLALVPPEPENFPRYFIMTGKEIIKEIRAWTREHPTDKMTGFNWSRALEYEDLWDKLPS